MRWQTQKQESSTRTNGYVFFASNIDMKRDGHAAGKHTGLGTEIDKETHECTHVRRCHALSISVRSQ